VEREPFFFRSARLVFVFRSPPPPPKTETSPTDRAA
jgi:hypothetical protein